MEVNLGILIPMLTPMSKYEQLRDQLLAHYKTGCCNYGRKLGGDRRPTIYYTVWNLCPVARELLKQIEELF